MTFSIHPFSLELRTPLETAKGTLTERTGFVIQQDGESIGIGEATPLPGWTEDLETCEQYLKTAIQTYEAKGLEAALETLDRAPAARHGFSLAATDKHARHSHQPLYQYLGQDQTIERLEVNKTIGATSRSQILDTVENAIAAGFQAIKIKIGIHDPMEDISTLKTIRENIPRHTTLRADVNGKWTTELIDPHIESLRNIDLEYLEQPLAPDDLQNHVALKEASLPVALDESLRTSTISRILALNAADFIIIKPMVVGGIDRARAIAIRCLNQGVIPIVTTTYDGVVARTGAVHLMASLPTRRPAGLATAERLKSDLATDPAPIHAGQITVPQTRGIGVQTDISI